jgi:hypothetical protein
MACRPYMGLLQQYMHVCDITQDSVGRWNELNFIAVRWQIWLSVRHELRCTYVLTLPAGRNKMYLRRSWSVLRLLLLRFSTVNANARRCTRCLGIFNQENLILIISVVTYYSSYLFTTFRMAAILSDFFLVFAFVFIPLQSPEHHYPNKAMLYVAVRKLLLLCHPLFFAFLIQIGMWIFFCAPFTNSSHLYSSLRLNGHILQAYTANDNLFILFVYRPI